MKSVRIATLMLCLIAPVIAMTQQTALAQGTAPAPKVPVAVDWEFASGATTKTVLIRIKNVSQGEISIEHPGNRMAVAFVVLNELGNTVAPQGVAKVNQMKHSKIILKPGETFEHIPSDTRLAHTVNAAIPFLTGSALFAYELKKGATYRITMIYRPNGEAGDGIASPEHIVKIK